MKTKSLLTTLFLILGLGTYTVLNTSYSSGFGTYQSNCSCHGGANGNTTVAITAPTFYTPGSSYPVSVTVTNPTLNLAGFQVQTNIGSLSTADAGISIQGGMMSAGHNTRKSMAGNTASFNLTWTAPAAASGAAVFNAVGNAVNGGGTGGDQWNSAPATNVALPVNFTDIQATVSNNSIQISFATSDEENIQQFEIERSLDGETFKTINTLNPSGNAKYTSVDYTALNNILYYYRVKEVSQAGKNSFSSVVTATIKSDKSNNILIYPTVITNSKVSIDGLNSSELNTVEVYDMSGKKIQSQKLTSATLELDQLVQGFYILNVKTNNQSVKTQRIMIQ